jgi:hypothetical protein
MTRGTMNSPAAIAALPEPKAASPLSEPLLLQRARAVLHDLIERAAARVRAEQEAEAGLAARTQAAETTYQETRERLTREYQAAKERTEKEYTKIREDIAARFEAGHALAEKAFTDSRRKIIGQFGREREALEAAFQEARWTTNAYFEAAKTKAESQWREAQQRLTAYQEEIEEVRQEADRVLGTRVKGSRDVPKAPEPAASPEGDLLHRFKARLEEAETLLARSDHLFSLKLLKGHRYLAFVAVLWACALFPAAYTAQWLPWLAGGTVGAVVLAVGLRAWLHAVGRAQAARLYHPLSQALAEAKALRQSYHDHLAVNHERQLAKHQERHDTGSREAEDKYNQDLAAITQRRDTDSQQIDEKHQRDLAEVVRRRDAFMRHAEERYPRLLADIQERYEAESRQLETTYRRQTEETRTRHHGEWETLARNWRDGLAKAQAAVAEIRQASGRLFPPWDSLLWDDWPPATELPPVIRFGEFRIGLNQIPHGVPERESVRALGPLEYTLPALVAFPAGCSLLFKAGEGGRAAAEQALQTVMLRLLTAVPPAKVRFTIIDPVGLGQNFAAFMHLADHDEALVTSRIWTEQPHIEQRLTDLMAHMENVIQKFLRNQFQTIEEYNAHAGEVAEPFRFLVVANFPANFSLEAMRRLVSIAASGARCGVHLLITVDPKQLPPSGFDLKELERFCVDFTWKDGGFLWHDVDFGTFPFRLDAPPDAESATRILQVVGARAKEASRVEVPFEFIVPPPEEWWTSESRPGIRVALGRSGATKRQHLTLGQGTAQHVLIAGKTGSGKSTLLHALITNLSLMYSPEEVELYLVDFKEGVEFKAYATHELPHARLVAIESEREFGLSVLQRLEGELKQRGDEFRALGVQDLASYRLANGHAPMPRILLIVDEFQLFFIEDDKIAQDAALLLDRLVRQGRAFGIHVLLGSQTLGGAYSLARSTIGQMAVRIALQCSEADAQLILSDDNPAARLLSRPGEAIYNDANGLVEGNDFFQVCWLPDDLRESYLRQIQGLARARRLVPPHPQIVFEGKAPADVSKNHLLQQLLSTPDWPAAPRVAQAWLGEALAIKDPTAAAFRPQTGSNLLIIGQADEAALGILATSLITLAAQYPPGGVRFYLGDGSPVDAPHAGLLAHLAEFIPQAPKVAGWRDIASVLEEMAEEVERRQKAAEWEGPALYLILFGLQRFRDLRKAEDDFGFSRRGENLPPSPAKLFTTIFREGPAVGVHTLVWCDTLTNVNRALDRQALREFELRVLFQMSAADSSNLIDTPLASKLGMHRALFYSEDRGQPEKFRPYGLPSEKWLGWVKERFDRKRPG